ncbi:MAG: PilN domain-containing protein [Candidatus Binatia bacterium]|nr:PilN domain-containing protein [Candidatus Binatia bacterium]MDG1959800.1 PilN domain-containing protein [Candidatus Binatia bacterium]MDG2010139.1 PilN domain-containing protein [Candidatus Binatia bacterium]
MPREEARRAATRQRDQGFVVFALVGLLAVILLAEIWTRTQAADVQAEVRQNRAELTELDKRYQESLRTEARLRELSAKRDTIDLLERQRRGPVYVLEDLGAATPDALWLTEMSESDGSVVLKGQGLDNQTIALFMRQLETSPYFSRVDLVETKHLEKGQAELKEFTIRAQVAYAGVGPGPTAESAEGASS